MRELTGAVFMGLERMEALGRSGPNRLQHFLSRAVWDHEAVWARLAAFAVDQLADDQALLVLDETGGAKFSTDAVGAAPAVFRSVSLAVSVGYGGC
ncbi:transposase [Streptomyces sp. NPDC005336]|uniref:transposase n=1 Tax=Streptomyces sp. NPDC005336 TaxID=3157035 RepID=UPI0033BD82B4